DTACYDRQAGSNWITCGLSAGFVEPLESTSIFFMHNNLVAFLALASHEELPPDLQMISIDDWSVPTDRGPLGGWFKWSQKNIDLYNTYTFRTFQTTVDYIAAHYAVSTLDSSAYWNDWRRQRSKYVEIVSDVLGYANDKLFFSRPAYSMLSVGNRLGAVENWDLPRLSVLERQQQRWMSGELSDPRAILADRTAAEAMELERDYLGTQLHRSYLADQFAEHALDLVDQHQCLEQIDGESPDDW
ncbi:MAG: tryptophan 7-halogenase, partial [Pirellulales bacterium]